MGDTSTAKAAELAHAKQKTEDHSQRDREYAQRTFADAMLFRATAGDDPRRPPQHIARTLQRLAAPQQTVFLRQCQRQYGNAYVQRVLSSLDQSQPSALRKNEEDQTIQTKANQSLSDSFDAGADVEVQLSQSKGQGSPLPDSVRAYMEPRFGVEFSQVRVHTGSEAIQMNQAVGAQAFTHGSDIFYGDGKSPTDLSLTAHELTHVVQQSGNGIRRKLTVSDPNDPHEVEAEQIARAVMRPRDTETMNQQVLVHQGEEKNVVATQRMSNMLQQQPEALKNDDEEQERLRLKVDHSMLARQVDQEQEDPPPDNEHSTNEFFPRAEVEGIRARATVRYLQLSSYVSNGARAINSVKERLVFDNERYREAYDRYAKQVRAARLEAQNQQQWLDFFIGVGIGITLGVASELVLGEAASSAAELTAEAVVEGVEGLAGMAAKSVLPQIAGQQLEPGSLDPDVLELEI